MLSFRVARLRFELAELPVLLFAPIDVASEAGGCGLRMEAEVEEAGDPYGGNAGTLDDNAPPSASVADDVLIGNSGSLNMPPLLMFVLCEVCGRAGDFGGRIGLRGAGNALGPTESGGLDADDSACKSRLRFRSTDVRAPR